MIKKNLIITLDGLPGTGKSSQASLLRLYFNEKELESDIFDLDALVTTDPSSGSMFIDPNDFKALYKKIKENKENNRISIIDGGLSYHLINFIANGGCPNDPPEYLKECFRFLFEFDQKCEIKNLVLMPAHSFSYTKSEPFRRDFIAAQRNFNNLLVTGSLNYTPVQIFPSESMLEIQFKILKQINS